MYAISAGTREINDTRVSTFSRNVEHAAAEMEVEAGTTGFRGYVPRRDSARAFLSIDCLKGDFLFEPIRDEKGRVTGIDIACCGDSALMALVDSLGFAMEVLIHGCE